MGAVFEAEETNSGRRVALKVLSQAFDSPEAHARFLREGRLAASINHPNSVYVFGTEEIEGTPVIIMELVPEGTLKDRVTTGGPMSSGEAVEAILQVIDGLDCAQRQGILHRDIKPSNCFVGSDGSVKIGDFGLSISLSLEQEASLTSSGTFIGTPAYSSPEQLRGEKLTLHSDIYALGLTLYHLLTGRLPFEAPNPVQLLASILERRPKPPSRFRPGLPRGLDKVVLRCLEKDPEARFKDYTGLREALSAYGITAPTPATLGLRFLAGAGDAIVLGFVQTFATSLWLGGWSGLLRTDVFASPKLGMALFTSMILGTAYYGLPEGLWGHSLGKAICRLRVVSAGGQALAMPSALARAGIFILTPFLPQLVFWWVCLFWELPEAQDLSPLISLGPSALVLLLFVTARRSNGFAGLHDLLLKVRVVAIPSSVARPSATAFLPHKAAVKNRQSDEPRNACRPGDDRKDQASRERLGPYQLVCRQAGDEVQGVWLGYDPRLQRQVWLHRQPAEAAPVSTQQRQLGRRGRLRWLGGQRTPTEAWDAYEALEGRPLLVWLSERPDWGQVRRWLYDLATELQTAETDGSMPERLALDQVWITSHGAAKLLDFPIPSHGLAPEFVASGVTSPIEFLRQVAASALSGRVVEPQVLPQVVALRPLALHARAFLQGLTHGFGLDEVTARLRTTFVRPASISRLRRGLVLAGCLVLPLLCLVVGGVGISLLKAGYQDHPEIAVLQICLDERTRIDSSIESGQSELLALREAFDILIAARSRPVVTNSVAWNSAPFLFMLTPPHREQAEAIVAKQSAPTPSVLTDAEASVQARLGQSLDQAAAERFDRIEPMSIALGLCIVWTGVLIVLPCWVASVLFRGGVLFHLAGIALATRNGAMASRGRVLWRNVVAWLPILVLLCVPFLTGMRSLAVLGYLIAVGFLALVATLVPARSLSDRIAGTYPVAR
jgi:hypothetical protein